MKNPRLCRGIFICACALMAAIACLPSIQSNIGPLPCLQRPARIIRVKFYRHARANQGGTLPRPERCLAAHGARLRGAAVCSRPGGFALFLDYGGYFRKPGCFHRAVLVQHFKEVYPLVGRPFVGPMSVEAHDGTVVLQIIQIDAQYFLEIGRWR